MRCPSYLAYGVLYSQHRLLTAYCEYTVRYSIYTLSTRRQGRQRRLRTGTGHIDNGLQHSTAPAASSSQNSPPAEKASRRPIALCSLPPPRQLPATKCPYRTHRAPRRENDPVSCTWFAETPRPGCPSIQSVRAANVERDVPITLPSSFSFLSLDQPTDQQHHYTRPHIPTASAAHRSHTPRPCHAIARRRPIPARDLRCVFHGEIPLGARARPGRRTKWHLPPPRYRSLITPTATHKLLGSANEAARAHLRS